MFGWSGIQTHNYWIDSYRLTYWGLAPNPIFLFDFTGTVIGAVIMEGFYIVFDRENNQLQFASSTCSHTATMAKRSSVKGNLFYNGEKEN